MNKPSNSASDSQRLEQIVAYLDGELSAEDAASVESQLAADPDLSSELQNIDRVWSALDTLSEQTVSDKFSQTTMELVVGSASREIDEKTRAIPVQQRRYKLGTAMVAMVAVLLGMVTYGLIWQNPNKRLLDDLPVIQHIDVYSQVPGIEFVQMLNATLGSGLWTPDIEVEELSERIEHHRKLSDPQHRQQWLDQLDSKERVALRARYNRFQALSHDEQQQLRDIHAELVDHESRAELEHTLLQYQLWLSGMPASQQFELRQLNLEQRTQEVERLLQQEEENRIISLTPAELRQVASIVEPYWDNVRKRAAADMSSAERERFESFSGRGLFMRETRGMSEEDRETLLNQILETFSEEKRRAVQNLSPEQQRHSLFRWMLQTGMWDSRNRGPGDRRRHGQISQEELERFFAEDIDASTKERLLAQPRERMEQQLRRMYDRGTFRSDQDAPRRPGPPETRPDQRGPRPPDRRNGPRGGPLNNGF